MILQKEVYCRSGLTNAPPMTKEAIIIFGQDKVSVTIEKGRTTTHPKSSLYRDGDLTDERIPLHCLVQCKWSGAVVVRFKRSSDDQNSITFITVGIFEGSSEGEFFIRPSEDGTKVKWMTDWSQIICISENHAEHVINLLRNGDFERVKKNSVIE